MVMTIDEKMAYFMFFLQCSQLYKSFYISLYVKAICFLYVYVKQVHVNYMCILRNAVQPPPPKKKSKNKKTAHRERDICQFHLKQFSIDEIFIKLIAEDCCLFSSNMKYLYFGHIGSPRTF